ncbi:MAG: TIGR02996 domain-containing protein [Myxococcota bacterium]
MKDEDETVLLRAVRDDPTALAPRRVYADWLDEHGRTSAATVLREEPVWQRDARGGPSLVAVSQAAADVSLNWLVQVSSIRQEWLDLLRRFAEHVPFDGEPGIGVVNTIDSASHQIDVRHYFAGAISEQVAEHRFCWPLDHLLMTTCVSASIALPERLGMRFFDAIYDRQATVAATLGAEAYRLHPPTVLAACGLWLEVGFRDRHSYFVGADTDNGAFGTFIDKHDDHPWLHGEPPTRADRVAWSTLARWRTLVQTTEAP